MDSTHPLTTIDEYIQFAGDLLDPEVFGHSCSPEVRNEARRLLGIKQREAIIINGKAE